MITIIWIIVQLYCSCQNVKLMSAPLSNSFITFMKGGFITALYVINWGGFKVLSTYVGPWQTADRTDIYFFMLSAQFSLWNALLLSLLEKWYFDCQSKTHAPKNSPRLCLLASCQVYHRVVCREKPDVYSRGPKAAGILFFFFFYRLESCASCLSCSHSKFLLCWRFSLSFSPSLFVETTMASALSTGRAGRAAPTWWTCSSWEGLALTSWTAETTRPCTWPPATDIAKLWER